MPDGTSAPDAAATLVSGRIGDAASASGTPCFTPGTLIATPRGLRPVETLRPGDRVLTRDNGLREICWTGARALGRAALSDDPRLQPVRVRRGAFGAGRPARDLYLSPNHRLLVTGAEERLGTPEALAAVAHLADGERIRLAPQRRVTYHHFMFETHEIVLAEGCWAESFQPEDEALAGLGHAARAEILALFPALASPVGRADYLAARPILTRAGAAEIAP